MKNENSQETEKEAKSMSSKWVQVLTLMHLSNSLKQVK